MDKCLVQGCAVKVVQDHWTAEEAEEHGCKTRTVGIMPADQKREEAAHKPARDISIGLQNQGIRSEQIVDARQVEVIIELGNKPLGRRVNRAPDRPKTGSSQHHRKAYNKHAKTRKKPMQVLLSKVWPVSCQYCYNHRQQQTTRCAVGKKEAGKY